jgi:pimeloyl-ACP methyl ester carboxylesterase
VKRTPVVFIHGVWLHAVSWQPWTERFARHGFAVHAPGWPGEPATVGEARQRPGAVGGLGLGALTDHYARIVRSLDAPPVVVGHSVGGLVAQHLLGADLARAAVAIAPTPINGVPLPAPGLGSRLNDPGPAGGEDPGRPPWTVSLSARQFHDVFANAVPPEESRRIFEHYAVAAPRRLLAELARVGAPGPPPGVVDVANTTRGPLLLVSGQEDRLVPDAVTRAVYKLYGDSTAVSGLKQFPDRAHSLVVDGGWRAIAEYVLVWLAECGVHSGGAER